LKGKGKNTRVDKERNTKERLTFSIALLVRSPLNPLFPFLALRVDALFANTILDTAQARACVITLLAGLLTIGTSVLDLTTLGAHLGLGGRDETRRERVHVRGKARVRRRVDGQLRLDRVGGGLRRLIDPVIVGVGADGSHLCKGKEGRGG